MIHLKHYGWVTLIIILMFTFAFTGTVHANTGYKIISFQGKIKVRENNNIISLEDQTDILLKENDAVMAYPNARIVIQFPNGKPKTLTGPFYSTLSAIESIDRETLDFFKQPGIRKGMERVFDAEGQESAGTTKGPNITGNVLFYDEIKTAMDAVVLKDSPLSSQKEKKMNAQLEIIDKVFNAYNEVKRIILRALVWKSFGLKKKALNSVFTQYEGIVQSKEKQEEVETMEDSLFNEFLPIVVTIHRDSSGTSKGPRTAIVTDRQKIYLKFSSNFRLWWAVFYSNAGQFKPITNTIDISLDPQDTFDISKEAFPVDNIGTEAVGKAPPTRCIIVVACADWRELEKYDDLDFAQKELLADEITATRSNTKEDHGTVILKFHL